MNKEIAMRWVKALRSGKYKKTKGYLRTVSKTGRARYCCLGVLCDITSAQTTGEWEHSPAHHASSFRCTSAGGISAYSVLPPFVQHFAGMVNPSGLMPDGSTLAGLNDGKRVLKDPTEREIRPYSFRQIANFIEKNWEKL